MLGNYPHQKKKKKKLPEPHKDLLPAELALSKIEEVDPLHEELSDFINRQQIAYSRRSRGRIMDNEFGEFLKENFEENMSNYAKRTENESRGVGHAESYIHPHR